MAKLIFISPYLKGNRNSAQLANHVRYISTRDGVQTLNDGAKIFRQQKSKRNTFKNSRKSFQKRNCFRNMMSTFLRRHVTPHPNS